MLFTTFLLLGAAFLQGAAAHAADETLEAREFSARYVRESVRSLEKCQGELLKDRDLHARRMEKREAWLNAHVEKRGITRRSLPFNKRSEEHALRERQVGCVLAPEVTIGPYYLDKMPIRKDNREGEPGIEMLLELQFVNVNDCKPVVGSYIDMWHANATGVYSGFRAEDTLGETQLRGLQPTDENGVANFTTIWPGHYRGRAVHTHILAHWGGTVQGDFYTGGTRPHIGQVFYDQAVITEATKVSPYSTNTQRLTTNARDSIFRQQNRGYNALANIELIGNTIADGVVASIVVGIRI